MTDRACGRVFSERFDLQSELVVTLTEVFVRRVAGFAGGDDEREPVSLACEIAGVLRDECLDDFAVARSVRDDAAGFRVFALIGVLHRGEKEFFIVRWGSRPPTPADVHRMDTDRAGPWCVCIRRRTVSI